jgi:Phosphoinositide phospholipase C, Ca2+-dependent
MATSIEDSALQNIIFKALHNSYNRDETIAQQLTFNSTAAYQCGCRGIEFDIWRHDDNNPPMNPGYFTVDHTSSFSGETLQYWLDQVLSWHKDNPNHDLVWIMLDIKSSQGDSSTFPNQIDSYLTDYFGLGLIASPKFLFPTLSDANPIGNIVASEGWTTLGTVVGKFIFCLSGNEDWKNVYVNQNPSERLCFADTDDDKKLGNKRVVYNVEAGDEKTSVFQSLIQKNIFIRVYDTNSNNDWTEATNMGANMLATNKVSNSTWAEVSADAAFNHAKRQG